MYQRKLEVFLCHASQDKPIVQKLYYKLIAEGWIHPWLDAKELLPGQDWQTEIKIAVEKADNVIIFLSNMSINKDGFIQKELRLAKDIAMEKTEGSIFLIPLRLENCEVPRSLHDYHWADYFGENQEQTYNTLLKSLKLRLEELEQKELLEKQSKQKPESPIQMDIEQSPNLAKTLEYVFKEGPGLEKRITEYFMEVGHEKGNNDPELESRIAFYYMAAMRAISDEAKNGPRLFTFREREVGLSPKRLFSYPLELQLWCEAEGH